MREFILSCVTATAAIIGIILSVCQLRESNRQALFKQRVKCLIKARGLMELYKENRESILKDKDQSPYLTVDMTFLDLTNNSYLCDISEVIQNLLNPPLQRKFTIRLEDLKELSQQIRFSFTGDDAEKLSEFIIQYQRTLYELYKYQILIKKMSEANEKKAQPLETLQQDIGEPGRRKKLWNQLDQLDSAYNELKDNGCLTRLEKKTRLHC